MVRTAGIPGDAARTLLDITARSENGTWHLQPDDPEAPDVRIEIQDGRLIDLDRPGLPSVLQRALVIDGPLSSRERDRLTRRAAEQQVCAGLLCLEEGLVDSEAAGAAIGKVLDADLMLVLGAGEATWSGPSQQPIHSGLAGRVDLGESIEEVLFRSAHQHRLWEGITDLPMLRDVVAATPSALSIISNPQVAAEEKLIIESADGQRDVGEIAGSRPDPWRALERLTSLIEEGHLETQSAMELFRSGESFQAAGDHDTALRRWRRAEELGLDDFDLGAKIGGACASTGRRSEAARRLRCHAQRCTDQVRIEAARDAWSGVAMLDTTDVDARNRALALWNKSPGTDPGPPANLAQALIDAGENAAACQLLDSIGAHLPDPMLHAMHEQAAANCGDPEASQRARWRRAEALRARHQWQDAERLYLQIESDSDDTSLLMLRLAEAALQRQDVEAARSFSQRALFMTGETPRSLDSESREAIEAIASHAEAPATMHRWIADDARLNQKPKLEATARQLQWLAHLREGAPEEARMAAQRCHLLSPEDPRIALDRAMLERDCHETGIAAAILDSLLQQLPVGDAHQTEVVESLLELAPTSRVGLERALALTEKDTPRHASLKLSLGLVKLLQGDRIDARPEDGPVASVLEILSALLRDGEERKSVLCSVGNRAARSKDPLLELLRAELAGLQPDHPLLQEQIPSAPIPTSRGAVVRSSIGGITEKLKGLQTSPQGQPGSVEAAVATTAGSPAPSTADPPPASSGGIQSALDRLRSLRGDGTPGPQEAPAAAESRPEEPGASETPAAHPDPIATRGLDDAAARLGALREDSTES
ncbi:MAG: hypothetical protein VX949_08930 [Planctomycetota bacterium]|nr:hypothetical protein [Planctomycetota bacterium]